METAQRPTSSRCGDQRSRGELTPQSKEPQLSLQRATAGSEGGNPDPASTSTARLTCPSGTRAHPGAASPHPSGCPSNQRLIKKGAQGLRARLFTSETTERKRMYSSVKPEKGNVSLLPSQPGSQHSLCHIRRHPALQLHPTACWMLYFFPLKLQARDEKLM